MYWLFVLDAVFWWFCGILGNSVVIVVLCFVLRFWGCLLSRFSCFVVVSW